MAKKSITNALAGIMSKMKPAGKPSSKPSKGVPPWLAKKGSAPKGKKGC